MKKALNMIWVLFRFSTGMVLVAGLLLLYPILWDSLSVHGALYADIVSLTCFFIGLTWVIYFYAKTILFLKEVGKS